MEVYIADAFTNCPFSGNQAGVVLLGQADFPRDTLMRALAGELKHSETAFVRRTGERSFHVRFFTPVDEVDLCGHATVAAFTVLREAGGIETGAYTLQARAGNLEIRLEEDAVWMDMARPQEGRRFDEAEQSRLYAAFGLEREDRREGLEAQVVSTGLMDIFLPVKDRAALNGEEVCRLSREFGVTGVHMFCLEGEKGVTARCRNFAPLYGIAEEAATGTSSGALTYYLYRRGLVVPGEENRFIQGEAMGKPSEILSRLEDTQEAVRIQIGGQAVLTMVCRLLAI